MDGTFSKDVYCGYIVKGDLIGAMDYVGQFPERAGLYRRFVETFEQGRDVAYEVDDELNRILGVYQRYYRDAFYFRVGEKAAGEGLRKGLAGLLGVEGTDAGLDDMEENQIAEAFRRKGFHFLGGRTSGHYGPYVWRTTETKTYEVELPDGVQAYTVKLLDGFISRSWIDYLSFGEIGPGGWSDGDGVINCVKSSYDFDSEDFKVSLLKHEAQHARDLAANPNLPSEELEYRAKLVELIYSSGRNLLERFAQEADGGDKSNGHASASNRIMEGFARKLGLSREELAGLPIGRTQAVARALFKESGRA